MRETIGFLFALALVGGLFWFGEHDGYDRARSECQAASQQGDILAEHARYLNLRAQLAKQNTVVTQVQSEKTKVETLLDAAQERVKTVKVARDCTLGPGAIAALNSVRQAGSP